MISQSAIEQNLKLSFVKKFPIIPIWSHNSVHLLHTKYANQWTDEDTDRSIYTIESNQFCKWFYWFELEKSALSHINHLLCNFLRRVSIFMQICVQIRIHNPRMEAMSKIYYCLIINYFFTELPIDRARFFQNIFFLCYFFDNAYVSMVAFSATHYSLHRFFGSLNVKYKDVSKLYIFFPNGLRKEVSLQGLTV